MMVDTVCELNGVEGKVGWVATTPLKTTFEVLDGRVSKVFSHPNMMAKTPCFTETEAE